jgi:6-pyruvoyltetrahydropterin/6-carboxytetrahydropterin synthase
VIGNPNDNKESNKYGMVIDFKDLKTMVKGPVVDFFDHSLVVYKEAEGDILVSIRQMYEKVHVFDFQPTCENLVLFIVDAIRPALLPGIELQAVKLYETATSYAEWHAGDNL